MLTTATLTNDVPLVVQPPATRVVVGPEGVEHCLPHRRNWLFIQFLNYIPGAMDFTAMARVPRALIAGGHFPQFAITPGVLIAEMIAQATACCAIHSRGIRQEVRLLMYEGKCRAPILPDLPLLLEVAVEKAATSRCVAFGKLFTPDHGILCCSNNGTTSRTFAGEAKITGLFVQQTLRGNGRV